MCPERPLHLTADVGRWFSGWASGVLADVDRCWSGPASQSTQAVIAQMRFTERALQIAADVGRRCSGWESGVLGAVDCWVHDTRL